MVGALDINLGYREMVRETLMRIGRDKAADADETKPDGQRHVLDATARDNMHWPSAMAMLADVQNAIADLIAGQVQIQADQAAVQKRLRGDLMDHEVETRSYLMSLNAKLDLIVTHLGIEESRGINWRTDDKE